MMLGGDDCSGRGDRSGRTQNAFVLDIVQHQLDDDLWLSVQVIWKETYKRMVL